MPPLAPPAPNTPAHHHPSPAPVMPKPPRRARLVPVVSGDLFEDLDLAEAADQEAAS